MQYYPIYLALKNKPVLIVGGGKVAFRKAEQLLKAGAKVTILATRHRKESAKGGRRGDSENPITYICKAFEPQDVSGFKLVIAATSDRKVNESVAKACEEKNILVNVVDDKELSEFILPSIVDRDPLLIAISTSGIAPGLSKKIRKSLEKQFEANYSDFLRLISEYREQINSIQDAQTKQNLWNEIVSLTSDNLDYVRERIEGFLCKAKSI